MSDADRPALLAATDLSSRSDRALRRAGMLAVARRAVLHVVHVVDDDQPRRLVLAALEAAGALLRAQLDALPELRGPEVIAEVVEGDPFAALLEMAERRGAELIMVGEHRRGLLRDVFSGTTAERVMRHGTRPVLMVNQPPTGPYRHVALATDLSEPSARAARAAAALGLLDGAELTLLHAQEPPGLGAMAMANLPPEDVAAHAADAAREAGSALARFAAGLGLPAAPALRVLDGRPATAVKAWVARTRPDLLVLGTAGAGWLRRAVVGSVAAELLASVGCDVLAVPPGPG